MSDWKDALHQKAESITRAGGQDVDVDAEHDKDTARRASNADLHRQASHGSHAQTTVAQADDPAREHERSDVRSKDTIAAYLQLLAAELNSGFMELRDIDTKTFGDAGDGPRAELMNNVYKRVITQAKKVDELFANLGVDKNMLKFVAPDIRLVLAAYSRFQPWIYKMNQKYQLGANFSELRDIIDAFGPKVGFAEHELEGDHSVNKTTVDGGVSAAVNANVDAALEAAKSMQAGNTQDGARMLTHLRELAFLAEQHPGALKSHKHQIQQLTTTAHALEKQWPELKPQLEYALKQLKQAH